MKLVRHVDVGPHAEAEELEEAAEEVAAEAIAGDLETAAELEEVLVEDEVRSDG